MVTVEVLDLKREIRVLRSRQRSVELYVRRLAAGEDIDADWAYAALPEAEKLFQFQDDLRVALAKLVDAAGELAELAFGPPPAAEEGGSDEQGS